MYTDAMRTAFHAVRAPQGVSGIELLDNDTFITIRLDERNFVSLTDEKKREAIEYVFRVKAALEDNGAVVLVVRRALRGKK